MSKLTLITLWAMRMWLGAICLFALVLIWRHVDNQNGWVLGDWMIDYRQGFVRRGLSGTVAQFLSEFLPGQALTFIGGFITITWLVIAYFFARILGAIRMPVWYAVLLLSPAGLFFSVYGADQVGRKEILLFASLAVFVWRLINGARDSWAIHMLWALWGALLVFMHEGAVFFGAYFVMAAVWVTDRHQGTLRSAAGVMLGMLLATVLLLVVAEPLNGKAFCASLVSEGRMSVSICDGTITWPIHSISESLDNTLLSIGHFSYGSVYGLSLLFAVGPVLFWLFLDRAQRALNPTQLAILVLVWVASVPLFLIAVDWGRFIQTHMVLTTLVLALGMPRRLGAEPVVNWTPLMRARWRWFALVLTVATYALWNLPVCCQPEVGGGLLPKLRAGMDFFL